MKFPINIHNFSLLILINISISLAFENKQFFLSTATRKTIESKSSITMKTESLVNLIKLVVQKYFKDCAIGVIYDSSYDEYHPIEFRDYFAGMPFTFTQESIDFSRIRHANERRTDKCTNYVIFLGNIFAIEHIMTTNIQSKIVIVSPETPWEIKSFLKSPVSRMYMHLLVISHSTSRRNGDGSYLLYTHKLYAEGSGSTQPMLLASWINNSLNYGDDQDLFPDKLKRGFMGHRLLVSAAENPPFAIRLSRSAFGSSDSQWDGIEVRLLRLSAAYLNFTVELTLPLTIDPSSTLSQIDLVKNDVSEGLTSAAIGGIYQTSELGELFDTTMPHFEDCAAFISLASTALPKYRAILGPFQLPVWILLCISYFILIIPLSFNSKYTILSLLKHPSGLNKMFWFVFSTYTNSFIVENPLLEYGIAKNSITILLGIYWVFTIIITACYTGSIVAFITLPVFPTAIETSEELLSYRYRVGTLDSGGWEKWFNENATDDDPFLVRLFRRIEYVPSLLEGVQNASRAYFWPYAFLASRTALDYIVQTDFAPTWSTKRSLMHISNECFVRYNVVQLYPAKSLYTKYMNDFVLRATETGLLDNIVTDIDWEIQRIAMRTNKQITKGLSQHVLVEDRVLTVEDTQGMFLILGSGVLMALLALSLEHVASFWYKRKIPKEDKSIYDSWPQEQNQEYLTDSWIIREDAFPGIRQRFPRGSV